jgi:hypothetical protein
MTVLDGAVIGQAHAATRAALEELLEGRQLDFAGWVTLTAVAGGRTDLASLRDRVRQTRVYPVDALGTVLDRLRAHDVLEGEAVLALTPRGRDVVTDVRAELAELTHALYGDLDPADLVVAGRVLTLVAERARARLAP